MPAPLRINTASPPRRDLLQGFRRIVVATRVGSESRDFLTRALDENLSWKLFRSAYRNPREWEPVSYSIRIGRVQHLGSTPANANAAF